MVNMVNKQAFGDVNDQMVHIHILSHLFFSVCQRPDGVKGVWAFVSIPIVLS